MLNKQKINEVSPKDEAGRPGYLHPGVVQDGAADPSGPTEYVPCRIKVADKLLIAGDNKTASRFLHEVRELLDEYLVDGSLRLIRVSGINRRRSKTVLPLTAVADSLVGIDGSGRIYLDVAALVPLPEAHRDQPPAQEGELNGIQSVSQHGVGEFNAAAGRDEKQKTHEQHSTDKEQP